MSEQQDWYAGNGQWVPSLFFKQPAPAPHPELRPEPVTVETVRAAVAARPGQSRARLAAQLRGRRATTLATIAQALEQGMVHEARATVPSRNGQRSVAGLYAGAAPAEEPDEHQLVDPGEYLRQIRDAVKLPAQLVAKQLDVSVNLIYHWESGRQPMPAWATRRLTEAIEAAGAEHQAASATVLRRHRARSQVALRVIKDEPGVTAAEVAEQLEVSVSDVRRRLALLLAAGRIHEGRAARGSAGRWSRGLYAGPPMEQPATPAEVAALAAAVAAAGWNGRRPARSLGVAPTTWWAAAAGRRPLPEYVTSAEVTQLHAAAERDVSELEQRLVDHATAHQVTREQLTRGTYGRSAAVEGALRRLLDEGRLHYASEPVRTAETTVRSLRVLRPGPAPDDDDALTGAELEQLRRARRITREDIALTLGVSRTQVGHWETGRQAIPAGRATQLRELLAWMPVQAEPLQSAERLPEDQLRARLLAYVDGHPGCTQRAASAAVAGGSLQRRLSALRGLVEAGTLETRPVVGRRGDGRTFSALGLFVAR